MLKKLKRYNPAAEYDCGDIAEKLVQLSNLPDSDELREELKDALYHLMATAQNPYNRDSFRVLYNVLMVIAGFEYF